MTMVRRVFGRTPDTDIASEFNSWFFDNINSMDTLEDEEAIQGTMTIDYQVPTESLVIEVQTYSEEFANAIVEKMKEIGFENVNTLGIEKEGGIK